VLSSILYFAAGLMWNLQRREGKKSILPGAPFLDKLARPGKYLLRHMGR
jgi:hypothetical protein